MFVKVCFGIFWFQKNPPFSQSLRSILSVSVSLSLSLSHTHTHTHTHTHGCAHIGHLEYSSIVNIGFLVPLCAAKFSIYSSNHMT